VHYYKTVFKDLLQFYMSHFIFEQYLFLFTSLSAPRRILQFYLPVLSTIDVLQNKIVRSGPGLPDVD